MSYDLSAFVIADPGCHIFNDSISSGLVPDLWKRANVVPIPKSHAPHSIQDDLRPISLTPALRKLLEATLGRRLLPKIAGNLDLRQFGALRGRSTTHALIAITHQCTRHSMIEILSELCLLIFAKRSIVLIIPQY
jgi:hypothetical protein